MCFLVAKLIRRNLAVFFLGEGVKFTYSNVEINTPDPRFWEGRGESEGRWGRGGKR